MKALTLLMLFTTSGLMAQFSVNDECSTAINIPDPTLYCSPAGSENNYNATPSDVPLPTCTNLVENDIWYSFTATSTQIEILVFANHLSFIESPCIVLYSGDCGNLTEVACADGLPAEQYQQLNTTGLIPGQTYYIRIGSLYWGTFQLCLRSALLDEEVSGDCPTATLICDKDPNFVPYVAGPGDDPTEWEGVECLSSIFGAGEDNSTWFVFTAGTNGTLEFTLVPTNPGDDLDFMVYHLPGGPDDCANRVLERCMVAGAFDPSEGCYGPTGLDSIATDISQPPGCVPGDDNFLKYMDLVAGESYALAISNFTSTGGGFTINWGGTVEFAGPKAGFKSDDSDNVICQGEQIIFTDTSSFANGTIEDWQWKFGASANPIGDTTRGPQTVQFLSPGLKKVTMLIRTNLGCLVKKYMEIQVDSCCALQASVSLGPDCLPDTSCQMAAAIVENAVMPYMYTWSTGSNDSIVTQLQTGDYSLIVQDAFGCIDTVDFKVDIKTIFGIPNAFTPNGDQSNDIFRPATTISNLQIIQMQVWNRWGNVVYDGSGTAAGWDGTIDGKPADSDVYVYKIKIKWADGREEILPGEVTLLR